MAHAPMAASITAYTRSGCTDGESTRGSLRGRNRLRGFVEEVRVPVMVLAGANDPRCPIRQIEIYLDRLTQLGKPHEVLKYDAGHGSLRTDERIRQLEAEINFVARHLGTPPAQ